jgi:HEAT repeat protein
MKQSAVPDLRRTLQGKAAKLRLAAALALGGIGPAAEAAVPDLIQLLDDDAVWPSDDVWSEAEWTVGDVAKLALGKIGHSAVGDLRRALKADNPQVRMAAALALGKIGPAAQDAVPDLIELLADESAWPANGNRSVADEAQDALEEIGAVVRLATAILEDAKTKVRKRLRNALRYAIPDSSFCPDCGGAGWVNMTDKGPVRPLLPGRDPRLVEGVGLFDDSLVSSGVPKVCPACAGRGH